MSKAILLIDCQKDFFEGGALAVPNSNTIRPVLEKITILAKDSKIPLLKTMDTHTTNDPEFKVDGTEGHASIIECSSKRCTTFNKSTFDVFHPELGNKEFEVWLKKHKIKTVYVAGVATDYCVKAAVIGLCKRGITTYVFENAIAGVDEETTKQAKIEMKNAGALFAVARL